MSGYVQKVGGASLFDNNKREKETHPHLQGEGLLQCPYCNGEYPVELSGWKKVTSKGSNLISLSIKPNKYKMDRGDPNGERDAKVEELLEKAKLPAAQFPPQSQGQAPQPQLDLTKDIPDDDMPF